MFSEALVRIILFISVLIFSLNSIKGSEEVKGPLPPSNLCCEYLRNPIGIDVKNPRFSWVLEHSQRSQTQTAFQVIVSTLPAAVTGDIWDSGKVSLTKSTHVVFQGKPLKSDCTYYWKVRYWDKDGNPSLYSKVARFDTGLFTREEWKGSWIGGKNELRKEFNLNRGAKRARAYICGLGYYELRLNGKKVGDNVLDPGWTTYDKRVLYTTYDVTQFLQSGKNVVGVMLGKGWSPSKALLLQVNIELEDGKEMSIVSDSSWKALNSPVVSDSIYNGEVYDARLETPGWDLPGFDDSTWSPAEVVKGPKGALSTQMMPPIKVVDTIIPLKMTNPRPGVFVFDLGQNFSGWVRLRVSGPRGTEVRLRHAELLYDDGMINTENLRGARAEDIYILKGEGEECFEPRFTYHGFRYVELTGFPGVPAIDSIRGRVVHSAVEPIGNFSCSKPILNQLQRIILWGQKTNLHSIPTDCCQRDERMGWLGDAHCTAEEAMINFDMAAFYTNFIRDIRDAQDSNGTITDTIPHVWGQRPADPAWGTAYPLLCWYMYQYYGDTRILEEQYEGLKKYVEFLRSKEEDGLVTYSYYGDWVSVEKTPGSLVSAFYYYYDVKILADVADVLGKIEEAKAYKQQAENIKAAFHTRFFKPETGSYASGTQTANALPLFLDMVPKTVRGSVSGNLINDIVYGHNTHLTTGVIGTKYIMELLTRLNASHLAYELATQTTYPSWGYMIENGATTLWELWQNKTGPSMNSHNHPMFGSVGAWLYKALAGINLAEGSVGYDKILIQPQMVRDLRYASGSTRTLRGTVSCAWNRSDRSVSLDVVIPVNSEAEVILPKFNLTEVEVIEGSTQIWAKKKFMPGLAGIIEVKETQSAISIKTGSGHYSFTLRGK